ncbi:hypothetical protein K490DRAFT_55774 [Saccharata proteae CBS 121410]|uniref:Uncharacterized protein n=1 Tax=Saccharata proteae CBS 121410 TaxID=1314787 RepID=A0A6A5YCE5_9PEZI|nr:hypothetical protein K490DRAFT_55774 [Saccharata proteae CBS 121410]
MWLVRTFLSLEGWPLVCFMGALYLITLWTNTLHILYTAAAFLLTIQLLENILLAVQTSPILAYLARLEFSDNPVGAVLWFLGDEPIALLGCLAITFSFLRTHSVEGSWTCQLHFLGAFVGVTAMRKETALELKLGHCYKLLLFGSMQRILRQLLGLFSFDFQGCGTILKDYFVGTAPARCLMYIYNTDVSIREASIATTGNILAMLGLRIRNIWWYTAYRPRHRGYDSGFHFLIGAWVDFGLFEVDRFISTRYWQSIVDPIEFFYIPRFLLTWDNDDDDDDEERRRYFVPGSFDDDDRGGDWDWAWTPLPLVTLAAVFHVNITREVIGSCRVLSMKFSIKSTMDEILSNNRWFIAKCCTFVQSAAPGLTTLIPKRVQDTVRQSRPFNFSGLPYDCQERIVQFALCDTPDPMNTFLTPVDANHYHETKRLSFQLHCELYAKWNDFRTIGYPTLGSLQRVDSLLRDLTLRIYLEQSTFKFSKLDDLDWIFNPANRLPQEWAQRIRKLAVTWRVREPHLPWPQPDWDPAGDAFRNLATLKGLRVLTIRLHPWMWTHVNYRALRDPTRLWQRGRMPRIGAIELDERYWDRVPGMEALTKLVGVGRGVFVKVEASDLFPASFAARDGKARLVASFEKYLRIVIAENQNDADVAPSTSSDWSSESNNSTTVWHRRRMPRVEAIEQDEEYWDKVPGMGDFINLIEKLEVVTLGVSDLFPARLSVENGRERLIASFKNYVHKVLAERQVVERSPASSGWLTEDSTTTDGDGGF